MNERGGLTRISAIYHLLTNFLVEILIETIPTCQFFVPKKNSGWKRFKIDPKVGTSFPYINSHGRPSTKNSGENVKEIREL